MTIKEFDWSKYEKDTPEFDWSKYEKEEPSRARSLLSALPKGLIEGVQGINPLQPQGPVPRKLGEQVTEHFLPTQDKLPEELLQRAGQLAPVAAFGPEGLGSKALQLAGGTIAGQIAKENEAGPIGQALSELAGMAVPGLAKGVTQAAKGVLKAPAEKLPSGLSKPAAMEAKHAEKAIISPQRQEKAIQTLNEEASNLAKRTVEKELPIAKKIEEGYDFEESFQKRFESLKKMADKANPTINVTPVSELLSKTSQKYRGIPLLHPEAKKIKAEVRALSDKPQTQLRNLLKIYRSNNQKIKGVYETSQVTGKQKEYVDFLGDLNRSIVQSFENTLPKDSAWLKSFRENNREFADYKNALRTMDLLKPIFHQKPTPAALEKLSTDTKTLKRLELAMGEKGAQEIVQISKDLKEATKALKSIPAKESKMFYNLVPLSLFVPGFNKLGTILTAKKGADWARRGYGRFLSSPKRRTLYREVLKDIAKKDRDAYTKSSKRLLESLDEKE